jgi:hypothetical protein
VFGYDAVPPSSIELINISVATNEVRAYAAVSSYCNKAPASQEIKLQLTVVAPSKTRWPLSLSMKRNALVGVGRSVEARMATTLYMNYPSSDSWLRTTCTSSIDSYFRAPTNGLCTGNGCCQVPFAPALDGDEPRFAVSFMPVNYSDIPYQEKPVPCSYGMVVENSSYKFSAEDLYGDEVLSRKFPRGVPFVIDFGIMADVQEGYPKNGTCPGEGQQAPRGNACASSNSYCTNVTTSAGNYLEKYVCHCKEYYEGNPYVTDGCQGKCFSRFIRFAFFHLYPVRTFNLASFTFFSDIDECKDPSILQHCNGNCKNRPGGYDCPCKRGWKGDGKAGTCKEIFPLVARVIVGKYQV